MFVEIARTHQVPAGEIVPVSVHGIDMILYRVGDQVMCSQRRCLHQGADLVDGIVSRGFLICPQHGWRYDAVSGVHEASRQNCLAMYAVRVDGDRILVDPTPIRNGDPPT